MLAWMRSFGDVQRIGIESTGSYGAGLLRFMQGSGIEVLEVTTPDKHDRRRRGKNDDLDAQNAAHVAFAGKRTVTPRSRDGMVESLRVLTVSNSECGGIGVSRRPKVRLSWCQTRLLKQSSGPLTAVRLGAPDETAIILEPNRPAEMAHRSRPQVEKRYPLVETEDKGRACGCRPETQQCYSTR
jgi:transposase